MALIKCPECGHDLSDKAISCPHCGYVLQTEDIASSSVVDTTPSADPTPKDSPTVVTPAAESTVQKNSAEISSDSSTDSTETKSPTPQLTPETNAPETSTANPTSVVANAPQASKRKLSKRAIAIIVAIVVAIVGIGGYEAYQAEQARQAEEARQAEIQRHNSYIDNLNKASYYMLAGMADSESACNLIQSVWHDAIFEKDINKWGEDTRPYYSTDFNEALGKVMQSETYQGYVSSINNSKNQVSDLMKQLSNPPEDCQSAYSTLQDLYSTYTQFTNLATNPTGSLQSFSQDFSNYDSGGMSKYNLLETQIPDPIGE